MALHDHIELVLAVMFRISATLKTSIIYVSSKIAFVCQCGKDFFQSVEINHSTCKNTRLGVPRNLYVVLAFSSSLLLNDVRVLLVFKTNYIYGLTAL